MSFNPQVSLSPGIVKQRLDSRNSDNSRRSSQGISSSVKKTDGHHKRKSAPKPSFSPDTKIKRVSSQTNQIMPVDSFVGDRVASDMAETGLDNRDQDFIHQHIDTSLEQVRRDLPYSGLRMGVIT